MKKLTYKNVLSNLAMASILSMSSFAFAADIGAEAQRADDTRYVKNAYYNANVDPSSYDAASFIEEGTSQVVLNKDETAWAGNYFSRTRNGIANRWMSTDYIEKLMATPIPFVFKFPSAPSIDFPLNIKGSQKTDASSVRTLSELRQYAATLSEEKIKLLSPIEKYDLARGDFKLRATNWEVVNRGRGNKDAQSWEGFCNGMRAAGIVVPEPVKPIKIISPVLGKAIVFEPHDIKALLSATFFYTEKFMALGIPHGSHGETTKALPVSVDVFDKFIRSYLGKNKKAFVIDHNMTKEIWNVSVVGYKRVVTKASDGVYNVSLTLNTLDESDMVGANGETKSKVAQGTYVNSFTVKYKLFTDASGRITGGEHVSHGHGSNGIDYVWVPAGRGTDQDNSGNPFLNYDSVSRVLRLSHNL